MKRKRISLLILSACLLWAWAGMAQNSDIRGTNEMLGKYSLVREWKNGFSVAFALDNEGAGYFVLDDPATNSLTTAKLPATMIVTDFRVHNDSVFFCGHTPNRGSGVGVGCVGVFDIQRLFAGLGGITLGTLPAVPDYYGLKITRPERMDVYENGRTHIVLVGEAEASDASGIRPRTTVCDAYLNGTRWNVGFYLNKAEDRIYTDIAANNQYVVAVGTDTAGLHSFAEAFFVSTNILTTPLSSGTLFYVNGETPISDVLVDDVMGERFVMAYQCKVGGGCGSTVKFFDIASALSTLSMAHSAFAIHGPDSTVSARWRVADLLCNPASEYVMLLQDTRIGAMPSVESVISSYRLGTLSPITHPYYYASSNYWNNIDNSYDPYYHLVGMDGLGNLRLYRDKLNHTGSCAREAELQFYEGAASFSPVGFNWDLSTPRAFAYQYRPAIGHEPITTSCTHRE